MLTKNIWNKKIRLSQGKVVDQRYPNMKRNLEKKMLKKMISKCLKKTWGWWSNMKRPALDDSKTFSPKIFFQREEKISYTFLRKVTFLSVRKNRQVNQSKKPRIFYTKIIFYNWLKIYIYY